MAISISGEIRYCLSIPNIFEALIISNDAGNSFSSKSNIIPLVISIDFLYLTDSSILISIKSYSQSYII